MEAGSETRLTEIETLEKHVSARVLVYFCGDNPLHGSQIAEDAVRPMFDHLQSIGFTEKLGLFLYSRGGMLEVPWRIVGMMREFCKELNVIVPYKAYSGATLIALGADKIIMGRKGELGPIDPSLTLSFPGKEPPPRMPTEIGTEDIAAFLTFIKNRAGLSDQTALSQLTTILVNDLGPTTLGQVQRAHSHIRLIARKLLSLCQPPLEEPRIAAIVEALTEKMYVHGHGIGRKEAREIGLQVELPTQPQEDAIWQLYRSYEQLFDLGCSPDSTAFFVDSSTDVVRQENVPIACMESTKMCHLCQGTWEARQVRKAPENPTINVNIGIQMPPGVPPEALPQAFQQAVQNALNQLGQNIRDLVLKELMRQSPVTGIQHRMVGWRWLKTRG